MRHYFSGLAGAFLLLAGSFLLTACDTSDPAPSAAEPITFTVSQRDTLNRSLAELGTYTTPLADAPVLEGALTESVTLDGYRGAWTAQRVGGNPEKDVIVFLLSFDGTVDGERFPGSATRPVAVEEQRNAGPTGTASGAVFNGTFYAFFVDGIGDAPEVPVDMTLRGSDATRTITVDPSQHTLPNDAVFQLSDSDVDLVTTSEQTFVSVAFESGGLDVTLPEAAAAPYPLYVLETASIIATGPVTEGGGVGVAIPESPAEFEFYVFQVQ
jgi:hypothetical protein